MKHTIRRKHEEILFEEMKRKNPQKQELINFFMDVEEFVMLMIFKEFIEVLKLQGNAARNKKF